MSDLQTSIGQTSNDPSVSSLRILHCFRSPVGGIFRHVRDLVAEQIAQGHQVGILCDSNTGGDFEEQMFEQLKPELALGLHRFNINRSIGPSDVLLLGQIHRAIAPLNVDVIHGHGAKGGAFSRTAATLIGLSGRRPVRLYCPHGGSMHYPKSSLKGKLYFSLERWLEYWTDCLIFVSDYEKNQYIEKVGTPKIPNCKTVNGLRPEEFHPVSSADDASDFIYIGMMRDLKGVDLFLDAIDLISQRRNEKLSVTLVGDGPDLETYKKRAELISDNVDITFHLPMPAQEAFPLGRCMVVPSRAESLPYIVLEALAAQRPLIAANVGGIPEIFQQYADQLITPDSVDALVTAMNGFLDNPEPEPGSKILSDLVESKFSTRLMSENIMRAYTDAISNRE